MSECLQEFDQICFLLFAQCERELGVVVIHHVEQGYESAIMIVATLVCWLHENTILANEDAGEVFLRPETAQGIFANYKNVLDTSRIKPPFGIAYPTSVFIIL